MMLLDLPQEIIQNIALYLLCSPCTSYEGLTPLGPPTALSPLLLVHPKLNQLLSPVHNPHLWIWREVFASRFDTSAVLRRCVSSDDRGGRSIMNAQRWLDQLQQNCFALKLFRKGDIYSDLTRARHPNPLAWFPPTTTPSLTATPPPHPNPIVNLATADPLDFEDPGFQNALLAAFVMALEDDGKNARQLVEWGHADSFCLRLVLGRWVEENSGGGPASSSTDRGWAQENDRNCLAISIWWMLCSEDTITSLPRSILQHIRSLLEPIVSNPFRYPAAEYPPQWYNLPFTQPGAVFPTENDPVHQGPHLQTPHGIYPPLPPPPAQRQESPFLYGVLSYLSHPLLSIHAKLVFFAINELLLPVPKLPHFAQTREEWLDRQHRVVGGGGGGLDGNTEALMGKEEYMREWRRRGEKSQLTTDVDELHWGWMARPPVGRGSRSGSAALVRVSGPGGVGSFLDEDEDDAAATMTTTTTTMAVKLEYVNDVDVSVSARWKGKSPYVPALSLRSFRVTPTTSIPKSISYDAEYWRLRLCSYGADPTRSSSEFGKVGVKLKPGRVYDVGSMEGGWFGRMTIPSDQALRTILSAHELRHYMDGRTHPELGSMHMPIVMRLWEAHLLASESAALAAAAAAAATDSAAAPSPSYEDPFWTDAAQNPAPVVGDNMLNAWFPGPPGTTRVDVLAPEWEGDDRAVELETVGWGGGGGRRRRVKCRLWTPDVPSSSTAWEGGSLMGNDSLVVESVSFEEGGDGDGEAAAAAAEATMYSHVLPVIGEDGEGRDVVREGVWTGHGYTHHPTTSRCAECAARLQVERHVEREKERARMRLEMEREKLFAMEERSRELREAREREAMARQRAEIGEAGEQLFESIGMGMMDMDEDHTTTRTTSNPQQEDEEDEEEDDVLSQHSHPSTRSTSSGSVSSFDPDEFEFEPTFAIPEHAQNGQTTNEEASESDRLLSVAMGKSRMPYEVEVVNDSHPAKPSQTFGDSLTSFPNRASASTSTAASTGAFSTTATSKTVRSSTQGCSGIKSIVLFGTSGEDRHGDAWGRFRYYGRVREWDGLAALLRVPVRGRSHTLPIKHSGSPHPYQEFTARFQDARTALLNGDLTEDEDEGERGLVLFYGYVANGGESFVGNWRSIGDGGDMRPGWEGSFVLGRRGE